MMTLELKHKDTYVSLLNKLSYFQLDDGLTPVSVKHRLMSKMKGMMAHMLSMMMFSM